MGIRPRGWSKPAAMSERQSEKPTSFDRIHGFNNPIQSSIIKYFSGKIKIKVPSTVLDQDVHL